MTSIRRKTMQIVSVSFLMVAAMGTLGVLVDSYIEQERRLFLVGQEMVSSAKAQIPLLIPGLLVQEEFGSVALHLRQITDQERLANAERISDEEYESLIGENLCRDHEQGKICVDPGKNIVYSILPISVVGKRLGHLLKKKVLSHTATEPPIFRPLVILLLGFVLSFAMIAIWISAFLKKHVRAPLLNLHSTLGPVLQDEKVNKLPTFQVSEIQDLAGQVEKLVKEFESRKENETIVNTTKMLAHDVRAPFNLLKTGLSLLAAEEDPAHLKQIANVLLPDVDNALKSVDAMICDVREFGLPTKLILESLAPEAMVEQAVNAAFKFHSNTRITLSYDFNHSCKVRAEPFMIQRVFLNILGNAIEAMNDRGAIWIRTKERFDEGNRFVEFAIGNSNSKIAEEDLSRVFDLFFSNGKRNGTGLGLAIVKKIIRNHGGSVGCKSMAEVGVEFSFTLLADEDPSYASTACLPTRSWEIGKPMLLPMSLVKDRGAAAECEEALRTIVQYAKSTGRKIPVQVIDNEEFCLDFFDHLLERDAELSKSVQLFKASSDRAALDIAKEERPVLILCDIDMGKGSVGGFGIVRSLRAAGMPTYICLHSSLPTVSQEDCTACGADEYISKPMSKERLVRLIAKSIQSNRYVEVGRKEEA